MTIKLVGLDKRYQQQIVLRDFSLVIPEHQITVLIGPSGSGKSTLLNLIAGLQTPDHGQIYFDQRPVYDQQQRINVVPAKRQLAMVFQDFALWPHMTVFKNVAFALAGKLTREEVKKRVDWALEQVGLLDLQARYPSELSGGQQQRVSLARALAVKPQLILFDEALSALDPQLRERLQKEIMAIIRRNHLTAIFVTHDRNEALRMADWLVLIKSGQLVQAGAPLALYRHPISRFAAEFLGALNYLAPQTAIRPEQVSLVPIRQAQTVTGQVIQSTFVGNHFDTVVKVGAYDWHIATHEALPTTTVTVYLKHENLLNLGESIK